LRRTDGASRVFGVFAQAGMESRRGEVAERRQTTPSVILSCSIMRSIDSTIEAVRAGELLL
jgi:hypothetical protein